MRLISRQRGDQDRRFVTTRITRVGLKLLDELEERIDEIHERQRGDLSDAQLQALISLLAAARQRA